MPAATASWEPLIVTVAPNGATKTHADHPQVPLSRGELAHTAKACVDAGAAMIHLHVRDRNGRHLLDADAYREATAAIRKTVGDNIIVQITSEAAKIYAPAEQMAVVRAVKPEAVSVAIRELVPDAQAEPLAVPFFQWLQEAGVMTQIILYSRDDLLRYQDLRARGVLPSGKDFLLFVLGRYSAGQQSDPRELLPFLEVLSPPAPWALCAFGPKEYACVLASVALGGHARVGFENNLVLPNGELAGDNAQLVSLVAEGALQMGRPLATAQEIRHRFR